MGSLTAVDSEACNNKACGGLASGGGKLTLTRCKCNDNGEYGLVITHPHSKLTAEHSQATANGMSNACECYAHMDCHKTCDLGGQAVDKIWRGLVG